MTRPHHLLTVLVCLGWAATPARAATLLAAFDFEDDDGGFVSGGDLPLWEWGEPLAGPTSARSGDRVWGTDLDGLYLRENEVTLTLPAVDLSGAADPVLVLQQWLELAEGDIARIEVHDGSDWQIADPVYGYGGTDSLLSTGGQWAPLHLDLSGLADTSAVRLVLISESSRAYGWYVDDVQIWDGDAVPPRVDLVVAPDSWSRFDTGPTIAASISDDVTLSAIAVLWSTDTVAETSTGFFSLGGGRFEATLPAVPPGILSWSIQASDGQNTTTWPDEADCEIDVYLPPPRDLAGPGERIWGTTVALSWTAPDSEESVVGYRVYRDDLLVAETTQTTLDAPAAGPVDRFTVTALFETAVGDFEGRASDALEVGVAVPTLTGLDPDAGFQGDQLRVQVTGSSLLLAAQSLTTDSLSLGEGVTVTEIDVHNVDRATFTVMLDDDAEVGRRDAVLVLEDEEIVLESAFTIGSGDERPALLSVFPGALEQGADDSLLLTLTSPPAAVPEVELGEGVVVLAVTVDGVEVLVDVAVANDAALGTRDVRVDDGVRILNLSEGFRVWPLSTAITRDCSCAAGGSASYGVFALLLGLAGSLRRRG